jgi:DNA mismatch endonuclease (patch repair protein)
MRLPNIWSLTRRLLRIEAAMVDMVSQTRRSEIMRSICSTNTTPEVAVRSALHALGYRFRLHRKDLPGTPDIVLPKLKSVIFVHGCFWHHHNCPRGNHVPKSNTEYWVGKIQRNIKRDNRNARLLRQMGWRRFVVWECQSKDASKLAGRLSSLLECIDTVPT